MQIINVSSLFLQLVQTANSTGPEAFLLTTTWLYSSLFLTYAFQSDHNYS